MGREEKHLLESRALGDHKCIKYDPYAVSNQAKEARRPMWKNESSRQGTGNWSSTLKQMEEKEKSDLGQRGDKKST